MLVGQCIHVYPYTMYISVLVIKISATKSLTKVSFNFTASKNHKKGRYYSTKKIFLKMNYFRQQPPLFTTQVYFSVPSPPFLNERVAEVIQKRDWPLLRPSLRNSWPSLPPHLPQETLNAEGDSSTFDTLSGFTVSVNAGQGEECLYLVVLENRVLPHLAHI